MTSGAMSGTSQSVVSSCDVTNCTFNKARSCTAGAIQVAFVEGMAHCATYTPADGATGFASDRVVDTTTSDQAGR